MNGYQLKDTVCALGFMSEPQDETAFFHAANLALSRLRTLIPLRRTARIRSFAPKPSVYRDSGDNFTLHSPRGICFYFEYVGSLTFTWSHGNEVFKEELVNDSPKYAVISRVFSSQAPITLGFSGESAHCVVNACIYDVLSVCGRAERYSEYFSYDMKNEDGFLSVLRVDGGEYSLHGAELRIPLGEDKEYSVEYSYRPEPLSYDNLGDELGIDPCLSEAAALLTAYYVWMDDDAAKAENYRAEYDIAVREIMKRRQVEASRLTTNGW